MTAASPSYSQTLPTCLCAAASASSHSGSSGAIRLPRVASGWHDLYHQDITLGGVICHLQQVLHIHVQIEAT